jgi:hypothetical protein
MILLGRSFVDQDWGEARRVIDTNITGMVYLAHQLDRGDGSGLGTGCPQGDEGAAAAWASGRCRRLSR